LSGLVLNALSSFYQKQRDEVKETDGAGEGRQGRARIDEGNERGWMTIGCLLVLRETPDDIKAWTVAVGKAPKTKSTAGALEREDAPMADGGEK